jgi:hypothetical protein
LTGTVNNAGLVEFTVPTGDPALFASYKTLTAVNYIGQGGTIGLNTFLGDDSSPSDRLIIGGGAACCQKHLSLSLGLWDLLPPRAGYLVNDMDAAIGAAKEAGADVLVAPFSDPIGRDAAIQWPGGVNMQLYWHTIKPSYPPLATIPENRVYVSPLRADAFIAEFLRFSNGHVVSDDGQAPGVEIGRPGDAYRRVRVASAFGKLTLLVTDGHLPFPYGRELTGYEVVDLTATLNKAKSAGVVVLVEPFEANERDAAMVQFPGGYIAEIHAVSRR